LKDQDPLTRATKDSNLALDWMFKTDNQKHLDLFFANTRKYDKMRDEDTLEIFPEWRELLKNMKRIKPSEGNNTFCMAPWTHTYLSPQMERRLCCSSREIPQISNNI
jgi:hypothetical protein